MDDDDVVGIRCPTSHEESRHLTSASSTWMLYSQLVQQDLTNAECFSVWRRAPDVAIAATDFFDALILSATDRDFDQVSDPLIMTSCSTDCAPYKRLKMVRFQYPRLYDHRLYAN